MVAIVYGLQDVFYQKMLGDPRVNFFFEGVDMKAQRAHQVSSRNSDSRMTAIGYVADEAAPPVPQIT